jgi:hypothetical protein
MTAVLASEISSLSVLLRGICLRKSQVEAFHIAKRNISTCCLQQKCSIAPTNHERVAPTFLHKSVVCNGKISQCPVKDVTVEKVICDGKIGGMIGYVNYS